MVKDSRVDAAARDLKVLFEAGTVGGLSDGQLLDRFVARREGAALEALVRRHGPMVWGVCRRVLRDHHDAEDAFQATWLVLARKAASVEPQEKVGQWLYGVACKTAMKARATRAKRRVREAQVPDPPEPGTGRADPLHDLLSQLDQELSGLPEKYRVPIVLCELVGMSHREAALRLGCPIGTLSGRLARARAMLARRLSRLGLRHPGGSLVVLLPRVPASAGVPVSLVASTVKAVCPGAAGQAAPTGLISAEVAAMTEGMLRTMLFTKSKAEAWLVLTVGLLAIGAGVVAQQGPGARPAESATVIEAGPGREEPGDGRGDRVEVDGALAKAVEGRIVRATGVSKDIMVLAYLPDWAFGNVDNIGIENHDGGVRTLLDWPEVPAEEAGSPDRRFLLACYSRKTTSQGEVGPILAFEVAADWPERTSWKIQPGYQAEPAATFKFEPGEGWKVFDVTPLVRSRAKAGRAGHGIVLRFLSEDLRGSGGWSGYQMVSREGGAEWALRRPILLVVEPARK